MTRPTPLDNYARQRGMATILIVLLAGMAITATTFGVMHTVRSSQGQQMASHASAEAESLAWAGVELVHLYLIKADLDQIEALPMNENIIGGAVANKITATPKALTSAENNVPSGSATRNFAFEITGKTNLASSTLRIVYNVTGGNGGNTVPPTPTPGFNGAMNIYDNLNLNGGLTFKGGNNVSLSIEGTANIGGGVKGVSVLRATGDITLSGGVEELQQLVSNGSITLSGGTSAKLVSAIGNISITSGGEQGVLNSNSNITISNNGNKVGTANALGNIDAQGTNGTLTAAGTTKVSNGNTTTVNSVGSVTVTGGRVGTINTQGNVEANNNGANLSIINANGSVNAYVGQSSTISAIGDVTLSGSGTSNVRTKGSTLVNSGSLSQLSGQGNLTFNNWGSAQGVVGGTVTKAEQWNTNVNVTRQPGLTVDIPPLQIAIMPPLQPFSLTRPTVDARTLENAANYVFKYVGGKEQITVKNVNGLPDGNYRLGKIQKAYGNNWGYLCKDTNAEGFCIPECNPIAGGNCTGQGIGALQLFCHGQSLSNKCLSYDQGTKTWAFNGSQNNQVIAPGIIWLEGNLTLANGLYRNTLLATGSINAASGSVTTHATNHAGYAQNCQNSLYGSLYPSNLCIGDQLQTNPVGNIALLAGSYNGTEYQGGNISVGSSTKAFGDIIAGNQIEGGGGGAIQGYITAAGLGTSTNNNLSAGLVIDLTNLPSSYTPGETPDMGGDTGGGDQANTDNTVKRLWVRPI